MVEPLFRRTLQPVRRGSRPIGTFEHTLWTPKRAADKWRALEAAERFDRAGKAKGARNGPLGHVALEVLRALWRRVRFADGALCPSIEWIQKATKRSRGAVVAALARLRRAGFVRWIRRLEAIDGPPGVRGPQVRQRTNAYELEIPAAAAALIPAPPLPDCEVGRILEREALAHTYRLQAFDDSALGAALEKLRQRLSPNASLSAARNPALRSI